MEKCLKSVIDNTNGLSYEIIVVDNASYDGCDEVVNQYADVAKLVQSGSNLGFARANNLGYRHSKGQLLLFLNPDTEIIGDALKNMWQTYSSLQKPGCLGCKVLNSDGTVQTSCVQTFPTIMNQFLAAEVFLKLFPKSRFWGMKPLYDDCENAVEVEVVAGSCLLVHRISFEKVGLFSEEYFMYAEDLDLCYKMGEVGYRNYYAGGASVVHHGGGSTKSTGRSAFSAVLMRDSVRKFLRKSRGNLYSIAFVFSVQLASLARMSLFLMMYPAALLKLIDRSNLDNSFRKWRNIFLWSVGGESWLRSY